MGRPAKSQALHDLHSTRLQSVAVESHIPAARAKVPPDFKGHPELIGPFRALGALLELNRVHSKSDGELQRLYSFTHDRHKRNVELLRSEGEIVEYMRLDSHGQSVPSVQTNLRLAVVTTCEKQMVAILAALGLTTTTKDKPRRTVEHGPALDENGLDPNSMAALMPHLFGGEPLAPKPPVEFRIPEIDEDSHENEETGKEG